jgi:hypothetical protein
MRSKTRLDRKVFKTRSSLAQPSSELSYKERLKLSNSPKLPSKDEVVIDDNWYMTRN